jgi:hypothetical protein
LGEHIFKGIDASDVDRFGGVFRQGSVVKVEEFLRDRVSGCGQPVEV